MKLSLDQLRHVARLSRLALEDDELQVFDEQLNSILEYMEQLNQLDTTDIPPTAQVLDLRNVLRQDAVKQEQTVEDMLENAPERRGDFFGVPRIIE